MSYTRRDFIVKSGIVVGATAAILPSASSLPGLIETEGDRLVLLGTQGGPLIRSYIQSPSASLIVYDNTPYVIDTGYGVTFKLLESKISLSSLRHIFITHHHSDHNLELGPLLYNC